MRLKNKILISFISIIFLIFIPLIFIMQTTIKSENKIQIENQISDMTSSKANEIDLWINQRITEIRLLKEFEAIENMDMNQIPLLVDKLNSSYNTIDKRDDETFAIGLVDGLGYISEDFYIDVSKRDYFLEVLKNEKEYVISEPVISRSDKQPIFIISFPINNSNNEVIGFINGSVSLESVNKIVNDIKIFESRSWIMNKNKDIYSIDSHLYVNEMINDEDISKLISHSNNNGNGQMNIVDNNGSKLTIFYETVNSADDWIYVTVVQDALIDKQTNTVSLIILYAALFFIIAFIIIAFIISNSIVKPISELQNKMEAVIDDNFDSFIQVKGNDEVSQLGSHYNHMLSEIISLIDQVKFTEKQKRSAELKSLQAQINPHFLYNTLDTLQWKALEENNLFVADMVNMLSKYFRIVLSDGDDVILLETEVAHVSYYLNIQEIRYKDVVKHEIDFDSSLANYEIPKLIIQPLVENAIYHGIKPSRRTGTIKIKVTSDQNYIKITVEDNGIGISKENLTTIRNNLKHSIESNHYGLYNVNERLRLYYQDNYKLKIESVENSYTIVSMYIPISEEDDFDV